MKPMGVEILVAELGDGNGVRGPQLFRIAYEGTITDEVGFAVLGGDAEAIRARFVEGASTDWSLSTALGHAVGALAGPDRALGAADLEVAVLSDVGARRTFRRLEDDEVTRLLTN
jgi:proteasome alpha subunit